MPGYEGMADSSLLCCRFSFCFIFIYTDIKMTKRARELRPEVSFWRQRGLRGRREGGRRGLADRCDFCLGGKEQRYCANSLCQSPWPLARPMQIVNSKFYNLGLHVLLYSFRQRIMCLSTTLLFGFSSGRVLVRGAGMNSDTFTCFRKEA